MKRKLSSSTPSANSLETASTLDQDFWAAKETLACAQSGCVPCIYKLFPAGHSSIAVSNQRPESCPRHARRDRLIAPIEEKLKVLTVGDGDFSFSYGLHQSGVIGHLVATSYETKDTLLKTYPTCENMIHALEKSEGKASIAFEVDATNLEATLPKELVSSLSLFDVIIWNFPCVRSTTGADGQVDQLSENQQLVRKFLMSAKPLLRNEFSRIHIAHKTLAPFNWWGIPAIAEQAGYLHLATVQFDVCCYPFYVNRKALDRKSFPSYDAKILIFQPSDNRPKEECSRGLEATLMSLGFLFMSEDLRRKIFNSIGRSLQLKSSSLGGKRRRSAQFSKKT